MGKMFDLSGKLSIPLQGKVTLPKGVASKKSSHVIVTEAYCAKGHSLISDVKVDNQLGIHFIYTDSKNEKRETEIVISPAVRKCKKKILSGEPFKKGEVVKIVCPSCRTELPILFNCECGAPVYLFYIDNRLDHHFGQSFCSRIGCVKASQLRFSHDAMKDFINKYSF